MKKDLIMLIIMATILVILIPYVLLVITPEREARQKELNDYCISKGYDEATSRYLGNYAGVDVVYCRKEVVTIDANGIADLDIISHSIVYEGDTDKK